MIIVKGHSWEPTEVSAVGAVIGVGQVVFKGPGSNGELEANEAWVTAYEKGSMIWHRKRSVLFQYSIKRGISPPFRRELCVPDFAYKF